jgi:hypothetical protein
MPAKSAWVETDCELNAITLALDTSLSDLAEQSPRLVALG